MTTRVFAVACFLAAVDMTVMGQSGADVPHKVAYASFGPVNTAVFIADADGSHARVLVERSNLDCNPSFSPDGRWVLFTSRRDGSAEIYRVRSDGTGLERLTDNSAFDDQAVMSPEGDRVAFVSSRSGQGDIWLLDVRTRQLRNLTNHPGGDYRPAWSHDGQWIAFTSDRDSKRLLTTGNTFVLAQSTQIYAMRADGSGLRRLTHGEASVGGAAWSPSNKQIAFYEAGPADWAAMNGINRTQEATSQVVTIDVETGTRQVLTSGPGRKFTPKWIGPERIGYVRADGDDRGIRFTDRTVGSTGAFSSPSWSPDRRRMVFHRELDELWPPVSETFSRDSQFRVVRTGIFPSYSADGHRLMSNSAPGGSLHNSILIMNVDGTSRSVVFDDPNLNAVAPVWSPTGDRVAFGLGGYFRGSALPAQVAVVGSDGQGLRTLTPTGPGNYGFPSWSPDGKRLVLRAAEERSKGLAIIDYESGKMTSLTSGPWTDNFPAWSPTGDLIVFASDRDGDWEIYTIRPDGRDVRRLTRSQGNEGHPAWSFDGRWIAFASTRGGFKDEMVLWPGNPQGSGDIFVMRSDGTDIRRLTDDAFEEATPAFAPK